MGADKTGHVLDHADDRHIDRLAEIDRLTDISQRHCLGGGHHHRVDPRHGLGYRQRFVAGAAAAAG